MKTETRTFNPENWTGEEVTVKFEELAGIWTWDHSGYQCSLQNLQYYDGFKMYDLHVDGQYIGCKVGRMEGECLWTAHRPHGDFTRQAAHPAEAAAKLLHNVM